MKTLLLFLALPGTRRVHASGSCRLHPPDLPLPSGNLEHPVLCGDQRDLGEQVLGPFGDGKPWEVLASSRGEIFPFH